jgi:hypothetical protein
MIEAVAPIAKPMLVAYFRTLIASMFSFIEDKSIDALFAICLMEQLKTNGIVFYH